MKRIQTIPEAIPLGVFLTTNFGTDKQLLGPLVLENSLGMIFGPRACGKSLLTLYICYAIAAGKTLPPWGVGAACAVTIFDGEMRAESLRRRLAELHASNSDAASAQLAEENITIISRDAIKNPVGFIDNESGQERIDALIPHGTKLIVIDNLSAWTEGGAENSTAWAPIKTWLIRKRIEGLAVLLVHHAGKGGQQRGSSAHEDLLDYSIRLSPLTKVGNEDATGFSIEHTKIRDYIPSLRQKFDFLIWTTNGTLRFTCQSSVAAIPTHHAEILRMHKEGCNGSEIGAAVGVDKSTVSRVIQKYKSTEELMDQDV